MNNRIRAIRKAVGVSQTEFGRRIGVSLGVIKNYEQGKTTLTSPCFELLCSTYKVNPDWLLTGEGEMFVDNAIGILNELQEEFHLSSTEVQLLETYLEMDESDRQAFTNFLNNLASKNNLDTHGSGIVVLHKDTDKKKKYTPSDDDEMQILAADTGDLDFDNKK